MVKAIRSHTIRSYIGLVHFIREIWIEDDYKNETNLLKIINIWKYENSFSDFCNWLLASLLFWTWDDEMQWKENLTRKNHQKRHTRTRTQTHSNTANLPYRPYSIVIFKKNFQVGKHMLKKHYLSRVIR